MGSGRVRHRAVRIEPATILCLIDIDRTSCRYVAKRKLDEDLRRRLIGLAAKKSRWGYRTMLDVVRRERLVNHKKLPRMYKLARLQVRHRRRRKRIVEPRVPMALPERRANQTLVDGFTRDTSARSSNDLLRPPRSPIQRTYRSPTNRPLAKQEQTEVPARSQARTAHHRGVVPTLPFHEPVEVRRLEDAIQPGCRKDVPRC